EPPLQLLVCAMLERPAGLQTGRSSNRFESGIVRRLALDREIEGTHGHARPGLDLELDAPAIGVALGADGQPRGVEAERLERGPHLRRCGPELLCDPAF